MSRKELAQNQIDKHQIENFISNMLNTVVHTMPEDPYEFMIRYMQGQQKDKKKVEKLGFVVPKPYPKMYVHLREPTFDTDLPIAKCLDKNTFKELRKKTSLFGFNLLEHIKQEKIDGNALGWVNLDRGSMLEFTALVQNLFKAALLPRASAFDRVAELNVPEKVANGVTQTVNLSRNLYDYPFLSAATNEESLEAFEVMEKFCLGLGFEQHSLEAQDKEFKMQEWLKHTVGNVSEKSCGVFVCKTEAQEGLTIALNVEDHVTLQVTSSSLKKALKVIVAIHNKLNDHKILAQDNTHGQVTVDPKKSGNAMKISASFESIDDEILANQNNGDVIVKQLDSSKIQLILDDNTQSFASVVSKFTDAVYPIVEEKIKADSTATAKAEVPEVKPTETVAEEPKNEEPQVEEAKVEATESAVEESKPEDEKAEEPKVEETKAEEPNVEETKAEEPKAEEPKVEETKAEEPNVEEPKVEETKAEEPKNEEPKNEEPKNEEPKNEEPKNEEPKNEEPKNEEPKAEQPKVEETKAEEPKAEEPQVEETKAEEPKVEETKAEEPKVEETKAEEPKAEEPNVEETKAEEPNVEEPKAEEPQVEDAKAEEPNVEETKAEEPEAETTQAEEVNDN